MGVIEEKKETQSKNQSAEHINFSAFNVRKKLRKNTIDYNKVNNDLNMYEGLLYSNRLKTYPVNEFNDVKNYKDIIPGSEHLKHTRNSSSTIE